jgi:hypothetical protein
MGLMLVSCQTTLNQSFGQNQCIKQKFNDSEFRNKNKKCTAHNIKIKYIIQLFQNGDRLLAY